MQETKSTRTGFIYLKDRRVLAYGTEKWHIPGGTRTGDESDQEMLISGIQQQLAVTIVPETLALYGTFTLPDSQPTTSIACFTADFIGEIKSSNAKETISFLSSTDAPRMDKLDQLVMAQLKLQDLID